jgi:PucR family transcriptional regulator, purine catabolism regulatory protein
MQDSLSVATVLSLETLEDARLVAGNGGISRIVRTVHILEQPDWLPWVHGGELILTTGINFPTRAEDQRNFIDIPAKLGVAGIILATGRFQSAFPKPMLEIADELGFPLIELPWDVPFVDVSQSISLVLLRQKEAMIERADRLQRQISQAAVFAKSLQDLTDAFSTILKTSIVFTDPQRRILAVSHENPESLWQKLEPDQSIPQHWQATESNLEPLIAIDRMACAVRDAGGFRGALWLMRHQDSALESRVLVHAATVFAVHLAQQQTRGLIEARLNYNVVDALLSGSWALDNLLQERARLLGYNPNQRYRPILLSLLERTDAPKQVSNAVLGTLEGFRTRELLAGKVATLLQDLGCAPLITLSLSRVLLLPPDDHQKIETLLSRLDLSNTAALVGSSVASPEDLKNVVTELQAVSSHARSAGIHRLEQMLIERILETTRTLETTKTLLQNIFGILEPHPDLIRTLETLVQTGFHQSKTAKKLGIHLNTLAYRLGRLETLVGYSTNDPEMQFRFALAVRLRNS